MRNRFSSFAFPGTPIGVIAWSILLSGGALAQQIDPCLVGIWQVTSVEVLRAAGTGGEGFRVTFEADGTQMIDYSAAMPWVDTGESFSALYRGWASGRIAASGGTATLLGVDLADARIEAKWGKPVMVSETVPIAGLGPGGLASVAGNSPYSCSGDSLQYETSIADDRTPTHRISLARVGGPAAPDAPVAINGRTWLTAAEIKDRSQDVQGLWSHPGANEGPTTVRWVDNSPADQLSDRLLDEPDGGPVTIDMHAAGDGTWTGMVYVCPQPRGTCPNLCRWVQGALKIAPNNLSLRATWQDRKSKPDCSGFRDEPDSGSFTMQRVLGVSFVPIAEGKYMSLVGAPAVGNQTAQFRAAVRIAADYKDVANAELRAIVDSGALSLVDEANGTYEFVTEQSGIHELRFELPAEDGTVLHTDRMRVEIPSIPGIGQ